jgi:HSP20 family protein
MSTFFEKLTSSRTVIRPAPPADPAPSRAEVERQIRKPENKPMHLKVEAEEREKEEEPSEEGGDEEGELTVDIYDKGDSIVIQSTVAGVKPEDLDVSVTNDSVTIRGKRECHEEVKEKDYYYKELFWGTFSRSVILPEEIDEDGAEATLKNGLLTIHLPKKRKGVVQKLKVKVT